MQIKILESNDNIELQKKVQSYLNTFDDEQIKSIQYCMACTELDIIHSCLITTIYKYKGLE